MNTVVTTPAGAEVIRDAARRLEPRECFLFFRHEGRFLDPLVAGDWELLEESPPVNDRQVQEIVTDGLVARLPDQLLPGIYAPVPIARAVERGVPLADALHDHRYEMVVVDDQQRWWWQGRPVADRLRWFLLEHLGWEPAVGRYYFEYRVSDEWRDKSYLRHRITPVVARRLFEESGRWLAETNTGRTVAIDPQSFRLDERERLFVNSDSLGLVMLQDPLRFQLLRRASEDLRFFQVGAERFPLAWPESSSASRNGEMSGS